MGSPEPTGHHASLPRAALACTSSSGILTPQYFVSVHSDRSRSFVCPKLTEVQCSTHVRCCSVSVSFHHSTYPPIVPLNIDRFCQESVPVQFLRVLGSLRYRGGCNRFANGILPGLLTWRLSHSIIVFFELCTSSAARATKNKSCKGKGSDLFGGLNSVPINWICSIRDPIDPGPEHRSKSLEFVTYNLLENKAMEVIKVRTYCNDSDTLGRNGDGIRRCRKLPREILFRLP